MDVIYKIKKAIYLIGVLFLIQSCQNEKNKDAIDNRVQMSKNLEESNVDSVLKYQYIENDSLTRSWITELTRVSKNDNRFKVENELRSNRHWDYMDTIKTLTFDRSRLTTISTKGYYGLWTAEINSSEIPLGDNIKVGMTKQQLEKFIGTKILSDSLEIGNLERTTVFEFNFEKNKLDRISVVGFED